MVVKHHGDSDDLRIETPLLGQERGRLDHTLGMEKIKSQGGIPVFILQCPHGFYDIIPALPDRSDCP